MELHAKSHQLLETLANSILDRNPKYNSLFFNSDDIKTTEQWLRNFIEELKQDEVCS